MTWRRGLGESLCAPLREALEAMPAAQAERLTEIRVRKNSDIQWIFSDGTHKKGQEIDSATLDALIDSLCRHSRYAYEAQMAKGYIPLAHGHRAGVCGRVTYENGRIACMSDVTSVCIRIARKERGDSRPIRPHLVLDGRAARLLLLGPPGSGKTSMLRDAARYLAHFCGLRVAVADEREELFENEDGLEMDVLRGADKADAVEMLLRTMSPQVILCDELGKAAESDALQHAVSGGVGVLASAHAASLADAMQRPALCELYRRRAFDRYALLAPIGRCVGIWDAEGKELTNG